MITNETNVKNDVIQLIDERSIMFEEMTWFERTDSIRLRVLSHRSEGRRKSRENAFQSMFCLDIRSIVKSNASGRRSLSTDYN